MKAVLRELRDLTVFHPRSALFLPIPDQSRTRETL